MEREDKKKKLLEFIKKKKEERRKIKEQKKIFKDLRKREYLERIEIEKERKLKEKKPLGEDFKLESKRKKERKEKFLESIAKKREEKRKVKQLILEEEKRKREEERERRKELEEAREKKERAREERELARKIELEKRDEERRKKEEEKERRRLEQIEKRKKLLQFLHNKKLFNQINKEKTSTLTEIIAIKKLIEKHKQKELLEEEKKIKEGIKKALPEEKKKEELEKKAKKEILQKEKEFITEKEKEKQKIKLYLSGIVKKTPEIEKHLKILLSEIEKNIGNFIKVAKKEILKKKPPKEVPEKVKVVPEKKIKPAVYKEPFNLNVFLRRNIFKFVFLILLIVWLWEFLMFLRKTFLSSEDRLKMIVGGEIEEKRPKEEKKEVVEEEKLVYWTKEKIDIEGKRDPFSTGRLTMEVMKKPVPTNIIFAKKPEVISIIKTPKFVSILKPEEKIEKPETIPPPKISSIEKPQITKGEEISVSSRLPEIGKVSKPEVTPFVLPEKECPLIYRGRMILEGVEYLFIEGTKRTYRVTVGDIVEGYRILKKENNKIILSKEGLLYEINAQ